MSCRAKDNGSPPDTTPHMMNLAKYFLIVNETFMPLAHLWANFLTYYNLTCDEQCILLQVFSANIFRKIFSSLQPPVQVPEPLPAAKTTTPLAT